MGKVRQLSKKLFVVLSCVLMLLSVGTYNVYASQNEQSQEDQGEQQYQGYQPTYLLLYPNGQKKEVESYEEAKELLKEVVLYEGDEAITDENGQIILKDWLTEGDIRIVEIEAPEGYEIIEKEKTVNLSEGQTTFENKKKEEPKPEPKKEEPRPISIPKTGIKLRLQTIKDLILSLINSLNMPDIHIQPPSTPILEINKADFVINKVDKEGKPLKGAKFIVYGKPKLYVSLRVIKEYHDSNEVHIELKSPSTTDIIKSLFIKTINASDVYEDVYIQRTITIKIDGIGSAIFSPEKNTAEFYLETGKTYSVSEVIDLEGQDADKHSYQSYLYEYQISVSEDGKISVVSEKTQWKWLRDVEGKYQIVDPQDYTIDMPICYATNDVSLSRNEFTITNYASGLPPACPPKCPEPCPPTQPCPLDGDNEQEQKCEPQQPEPEQQE